MAEFWAFVGAMGAFALPLLLAWWWIGLDAPPAKRKRPHDAENDKMHR